MRRLGTVLAVAMFLDGCAGREAIPDSYDDGGADRRAAASARVRLADSHPAPSDFRRQIDRRLSEILKDPESRRVLYDGAPGGGIVCGLVNAKNSFGGYTGAQPFYAWFVFNGHLVEVEIYPPQALEGARLLRSRATR